jgi:putative membrane protein
MKDKFITNLIILIFIVYNLFLVQSGDIKLYIHPRFITFTTIASIVALVFCLYNLYKNFNPTKEDYSLSIEQASTFLAVLIFLLLPAAPLSSVTADQRSDNFNASFLNKEEFNDPAETEEVFVNPNLIKTKDKTNKTLKDWIYITQNEKDEEYYANTEIVTTGFVYSFDTLSADHFIVARFILTCCAVDATPTGLHVRYDWQGEFSKNDWVEVKGFIEWESIHENGSPVPVIQPTSVTLTEEPEEPYLYL